MAACDTKLKAVLEQKSKKLEEVIQRLDHRIKWLESVQFSVYNELQRENEYIVPRIKYVVTMIETKFTEAFLTLQCNFSKQQTVCKRIIQHANEMLKSISKDGSYLDILEKSKRLEDLLVCSLIVLDEESQISIKSLPDRFTQLHDVCQRILDSKLEDNTKQITNSLDSVTAIFRESAEKNDLNYEVAACHFPLPFDNISDKIPESVAFSSDYRHNYPELLLPVNTSFTASIQFVHSLTTYILQPTNDGLLSFCEEFSKYVCQEEQILTSTKKKEFLYNLVPNSGMSLSGGEQPEIQKRIKDGLSAMTPVISHCYYVCTDTFGPIAAAFQSGGMVLISGTGSNCELVNPNGQAHRCGGWGHMLGDEGSAYWIAHRAIRTVYNNDDGLVKSVHDTTLLKNTVYTFFKLKGQYDILDHLYEKFCKEKIALLCKELATVAVTKDDPIIKQIFFDAGEQLGKHVMALVPRVDQSLIEESGCVPVLIEGSVFSSWNLLRPGFVSAVSTCNHTINLYSLTDGYGGTFGAAILGAKSAGLKLNVDYNKSRTLFDSINTL